MIRGALAGALLVTAGCAAFPGPWTSPAERNHPLAGRAFALPERRPIEPPQLARELSARRIVLLGEIHTNADHHRLQAWLLPRLGPGTLVLEMLNVSDQPLLDRRAPEGPAALERLRRDLGFDRRGWGWDLYRPVFEAALRSGFRLIGGNLDPARRNEVSRDLAPLSAPDLDRIRADLVESHCGHLPESRLPGALAVQVARDRSLARALAGTGRAVLIAGKGHVRRDIGVPRHLETARIPGRDIAALAIFEVDGGRETLDAYDLAPFDYVWFTPRADVRDPCDTYRNDLEKAFGR